MKKVKSKALTLLIILLFGASTLFAWPFGGGGGSSNSALVVDNDPDTGWFGSSTSCKDTSDFYSTIQDAINHAEANDTIEICPGTYEENVVIDSDLSKLTIKAAKSDNIDDVVIKSTTENPAIKLEGWKDGITLDYFEVNQTKNAKAIKIEQGSDFNFTSLIINSEGSGIYQDGGNFQNSVFENLNITSKKNGIYLKQPEKIDLYDMVVSSKKNGMYFDSPSGDIKIDKKNNTNEINATEKGIYIGDASQNYTIKNTKIYAKDKQGIDINNSTSVNISDVSVITNNLSSIRIDKCNNDINISNAYIKLNNISNKAIYIKQTDKAYIYDSTIKGGKFGIYIKKSSNGGEIKNNIIKNADKYGFKLFDDKKWVGYEVTNNCFESGSGKNVQSKDKDGNFDANYYDDWSGSGNYTIPTIPKYDENPLSSCSLQPKPIIDYKMDECSWDNDENTYEIENSGTLDDYNATAGNDANVTEGKICHGGDINSTSDSDKYISPKNNIDLHDKYTLNTWVKFPLNTDGHTKFSEGNSWNSKDVYYLNIADAPGSDDDFIYFKVIDNEWQLCVKNEDGKDCQDFDAPSLSGWKMLTFRVDGDNNETKFYLNADENLTLSAIPTKEIGLIFNSDYKAENDNEANGQSIGADVDEFEIYDSLLSDNQITDIYQTEDDSDRECPNCSGGGTPPVIHYGNFDAWDTFRDINDRNISTKKVKQDFDLTIASLNENGTALKDFNGTVCATIDNNTSKLLFENEQTKDATFNISRAIKVIKVALSWKKDVNESCPLSNEDNETSSTDNFAIRPEKFTLSMTTTPLIAGSDFNLTAKALDKSGNETDDYNETLHIKGISPYIDYNKTKAACITGVLNPTSSLNFVNGEANITLQYSEVGDLNVTIGENNDSEAFAYVDQNDTNISQLLIKKDSKIITILPHHFELNATLENFNKDNNFTYLSRDLNMSATLDMNITAKNEQNATTENYNAVCYAKKTNYTIAYKPISNSLTKILWRDVNTSDINNTDLNNSITFDRNDTLFAVGDTNGSASIKLLINFDRNRSAGVNPFDLNITNVNVTDVNNTNGTTSVDDNATFYYVRLYTQDLSTSKEEDNVTAKVLVYDDNASNDDYVSGLQEELTHWYYYKPQNERSNGDIVALNVSKNTTKQSSNDDDINATADFSSNRVFTIKVNNPNKNTDTHYIHLDVSPWIWYVHSGFGSDYNDSVGSECTSHPCIKYNYHKENNESNGIGVNSGSTTGVSFDVNISKNSRGIRLLR